MEGYANDYYDAKYAKVGISIEGIDNYKFFITDRATEMLKMRKAIQHDEQVYASSYISMHEFLKELQLH